MNARNARMGGIRMPMSFAGVLRCSCATAMVLTATTGTASAAAFALREASAANIGTAFAGAGSSAEDLSIIFYNPAGMTYFRGLQAQGGGTLILPNIKFEGTGVSARGAQLSGASGGNAGVNGVVPSMFGLAEVLPDLRLGIGVTVPFGLHTRYDEDWVGRYTATDSKVQSIDINPSAAYR